MWPPVLIGIIQTNVHGLVSVTDRRLAVAIVEEHESTPIDFQLSFLPILCLSPFLAGYFIHFGQEGTKSNPR